MFFYTFTSFSSCVSRSFILFPCKNLKVSKLRVSVKIPLQGRLDKSLTSTDKVSCLFVLNKSVQSFFYFNFKPLL